MISITVPAGVSSASDSTATTNAAGVYTLSTTVSAQQTYVFDAVLGLEHEQALTKTHHPVQTGASVSSHAYIEPARLVMYVLMSDVVGQYVASNQTSAPYVQSWAGNKSKSVAAYQQMLKLQALRTPLTVTTRLRTYSSMLILRVAPQEDARTITGARFRLEFEQLFVANTQANPSSVRPNDTDSTGLGAVNTQPPTTTIDNQYGVDAYGTSGSAAVLPPDLNNGTTPAISDGIPGYLSQPSGPYGIVTFTPENPNSITATNVPGAGNYSSFNTSNLPALLGTK